MVFAMRMLMHHAQIFRSSLLNAIMGKVKELSGATEVYGKLVFFSQSPFILNATLKSNILFSHALSAVDAHAVNPLFLHCIVNELMQGAGGKEKRRSVILATNAIHHLSHPHVDNIIVMRKGRIVEHGSYLELAQNQISIFSRILTVLDETGVSLHHIPDLNEDEMTGPADEASEDKQTDSKQGEAVSLHVERSL
jgi:ABC-type transport system involved in cytochrome bd biosynthesis fused ATPase/permease subunit